MFSRDAFDRSARQNEFMSNAARFAFWLAVAVSFLCTPLAHKHSFPLIAPLVQEMYGDGWDSIVYFGWYAILYPLTFYAARASLATAIVGGAAALALRFV